MNTNFLHLRSTATVFVMVAGLFLVVPSSAHAQSLDELFNVVFQGAKATASSSLVNQLQSQNVDTRIKAAQALAAIGDATSVEPLTRTLSDRSAKVRLWSAIALGRLNDQRAVDALIRCLYDGESEVRIAAGAALVNIVGMDLGTDAEKWLTWWTANQDKFHK
jgi:HEAT repeat protein